MENKSLVYNDDPVPNASVINHLIGYKHHASCAAQNQEKSKTRGVCDTPGPQYSLYDLTRHGKVSGPKFSLGSKLEEGSWSKLQKFQTPGPGAYSLCDDYTLKWHRSPSYSIGHRFKDSKEKVGPGPNSYLIGVIDVKQSNTGFSLGLRLPENKVTHTPGPGTYDVSDLEAYKTRQPRMKMGPLPLEQIIRKGPEIKRPGPNAYLPSLDSIRKNGPKFSFGTRHSLKSLM